LDLLITAANRDSFISDTERSLIEKAAIALKVNPPIFLSPSPQGQLLSKGKKVCFTGKAHDANGNPLTKEELSELAIQKGLVPVVSVTKKTCDLLVSANKSSMSGKTKLARKYGINVISVEEFLKEYSN
jgi:DNA polymerase-3 subunit epsilon